MIHEIENIHQMNKIIKKENLTVINFYAKWCTPCNIISIFFNNLNDIYPNIVLAKVNVDDCDDICASCGVNSIPMFHLYRQGKLLDISSGTDSISLTRMIDIHSMNNSMTYNTFGTTNNWNVSGFDNQFNNNMSYK